MEIPSKLRAAATRRLKEEYFVWMTTVGSDLAPQPRPVWFVLDNDTFLIYSQPDIHKVKHLQQHPRVALHFNADATADHNVLVFIGNAEIDPNAPPPDKMPAYVEKYGAGITGLDSTPEEFSGAYSIAIRVTPTSVRGW